MFKNGRFFDAKIKNTIYFLIPNYINSGVSLLLFPLIANWLGVDGLGQLDLYIMLGIVLSYLLSFGWASAHNRYYFEDEISRPDLIRTLLISRIILYLSILLLFVLFDSFILSYFGKITLQLGLVIYSNFVFKEFTEFFLQRYRMTGNGKGYMVLSFSTSFIYTFFVLFAIFTLKANPAIILICTFFSTILTFLVVFLIDHKWLLVGSFNLKILIRTLRYGFPLVPASLAFMLIQVGDRFMLNYLTFDPGWALILLGYYAFALRLVSINSLLSSGFNTLWAPYVMRTFKEDGAAIRFGFIFSLYVFLLSLLSIFLIFASHLFVPRFLNEYSGALPVLSILITSNFLYSVGDYFCVGIDIKEKTILRSIFGGIALIINLASNFLLIPQFGALGAALSTLVSTAFYVLPLMYFSQRLFYVHYSLLIWIMISISLLSTTSVDHLFTGIISQFGGGVLLISICLLGKNIVSDFYRKGIKKYFFER